MAWGPGITAIPVICRESLLDIGTYDGRNLFRFCKQQTCVYFVILIRIRNWENINICVKFGVTPYASCIYTCLTSKVDPVIPTAAGC